jgi:hypothetical protein
LVLPETHRDNIHISLTPGGKMKKVIISMFAVVTLMLAMSPATSAAGNHSQIEAALGSLREARTHLQEAKHDFHGHRADAIRAIDEAVRQLKVCIQYD